MPAIRTTAARAARAHPPSVYTSGARAAGIAWCVRLAARSRATATKVACRRWRLVTRDMLHRGGAARFADELGKAGLMHSMPARRIKGRRRRHGPGARSDRTSRPASPLPASGAARRASSGWFRPKLLQHIQPTTLVGREPVGQPALARHALDSGLGRRAARARWAMGSAGAAGTPPPPARQDALAGRSRSHAAAGSRPDVGIKGWGESRPTSPVSYRTRHPV